MISVADKVAFDRLEAERRRRQGPRASLCPEQLAAIEDDSPLQAWQCDRRAGKTTTAIIDFAEDGKTHPLSQYAYVARRRTDAESIAWRVIRQINKNYALGWKLGIQKLRAEQPNGAALTLYGSDNPDWIDNLYGNYYRRVYVDEAGFYRIDRRQVIEGAQHSGMRYFIYDVLEPTIADENGKIILMSRPGQIHRGLFHDICHGKEPGWSLRKWSWRDNPYVRDNVAALIERKRAANPDIDKDPSFRRNWCNEWVSASGDRVYSQFDVERNGTDTWALEPGDEIILGLDLGWHDHTAFSIITWGKRHPYVIELESYREREMLLDKVAARCRMYLDEYPQIRMVGDPGKHQAFEELRRRYDLPIEPAQKADKHTWIELINTDYAEGKIKVCNPEQSEHVEEMLDLVWDKRPNGDVRERHGQSNDSCDAFLYAFRYSHHFRYEEPEKPTRYQSPAWYQKMEQELEEANDQLMAEQDDY